MTAQLSPSPHYNLHVHEGQVRPVLVRWNDNANTAEHLFVYYGGEGGTNDASVVYGAPVTELRTGALTFQARVALGAAQREVATYRFEDVRDGSEGDALLGAELMPGGGLWISNLADALATLDAALDILADATGPAARRERKATESLRAKIAKLVTG